MRLENPGKEFIPASEKAVCPNMKLTSLEKILWALQDLAPEVRVPEDTRLRAGRSLERMLEVL